MTCGIYTIIDEDDKKVYVGQSHNIEKRWEQHEQHPRGKVKDMILNKNNGGNVKFEIHEKINLEDYTAEEVDFLLNCYESKRINFYKCNQSYLKCVNKQFVSNGSVPPTILFKELPCDIDEKEMLNGIEQYYYDKDDCYSFDVFKRLLNKIDGLNTELLEKAHYIAPKELMKKNHPMWKLEHENIELKEENEELQVQLEKCQKRLRNSFGREDSLRNELSNIKWIAELIKKDINLNDYLKLQDNYEKLKLDYNSLKKKYFNVCRQNEYLKIKCKDKSYLDKF